MKKIDDDYIKANFGVIWPVHVESFTWFLIECRRHFDGDLDRLLVLCVIGDRTFARGKAPPDFTYEARHDETWDPIEPEAINVRSISDFSGIPRETVRRKVQELIDLGWVERNDRGMLTATRKSGDDLAPLTEKSFQYLSRMAKALMTE